MSTPLIIIIASVGAVLLIAFFVMLGRWSSHRKKKKTLSGELAKKISKIKKEQSKNASAPEKPKDEFSLESPAPVEQVSEQKWHKKSTPIISEYVDDEIEETAEPVKKEEPIARTSFQDLMKKHSEKKQNIEPVQQPVENKDDFEEFRAKHSVFTSYKKDQALIEEIKGLSPELKAAVFGNLFRRINDD